MKSKTKKIIMGTALGLCLVPSMLLFTACGGQLDSEAQCNVSKTYSASTAAEFAEKTEDATISKGHSGWYRLTMKTTAQGSIGVAGNPSTYSFENYTNALIEPNSIDQRMALKTKTTFDMVGKKGSIEMESYLLDGNLYNHTLPSTVSLNYVTTTFPETKIKVEGYDISSTLSRIGLVDTYIDAQSIMDYINVSASTDKSDLKFEINEAGNKINFKVTFGAGISNSLMTNMVAYVNITKQEVNGYMLDAIKLEGDYSMTAGSGFTGSAIPMTGKTSITISKAWSEVEYPNFDDYTSADIGFISSMLDLRNQK